MGSETEAKMKTDPAARAEKMSRMDAFLDRNHDRELFGLEPLPEDEE